MRQVKKLVTIGTSAWFSALTGCSGMSQEDTSADLQSVKDYLYSGNDQWVYPGGDIQVCFAPMTQSDYDWPGNEYNNRKAKIRAAVESGYEGISGVGIDFQGWQDCDDWQTFQTGGKPEWIRVLIDINNPGDNNGNTSIPANNVETLQTNRRPSSYTDLDYVAVNRHEFGHALGFLHEFKRNDTDGECTAPNSGTIAGGDWHTVYDPDSILTSTWCGLSPVVSYLDKLGLEIVYPVDEPSQPLRSTSGFELADGVLLVNSGSSFISDWTARGAHLEAFDGNIDWSYVTPFGVYFDQSSMTYPVENLGPLTIMVFGDFEAFNSVHHVIDPTPVLVDDGLHTALISAMLWN